MNAREDLLNEYGRADTAPLGTLADLRSKLDAYRAEVLREGADAINALPQDWECDPGRGDAAELLRVMAAAAEVPSSHGERFSGELEMLRFLVRTLRLVARADDGLPEVRRLLWHHATDEAAAAEETSSREARLAQLLDTIRTHRGAWPASRVVDLRRFTGGPTQRSTARRDLVELHRRGHLNQHGPEDGRFYTLKTRKDRA